MVMKTGFLRETLAKESRAYGFTIAFWGSGAMLIGAHGVPNLIEALLYGSGAVIGFGILTLIAYRGESLKSVEYERSDMVTLGMIHYVASLAPLIASYYLARLDPYPAFLVTGIATSLLYNLGMLVEEAIDEKIAKNF